MGPLSSLAKYLILLGERAGTRTQDLLIKSQLLYRLSYALEPRPKALCRQFIRRDGDEARMRPDEPA